MKITHIPTSEIIINDIFKTSKDNLTKIQAISNEPKLSWCNGLLFVLYGFSDKYFSLKQSQGIVHYSEITYAECEDKVDSSSWNGYSVEVSDFTGHREFEVITQAIKDGKLQ